LLTLPLFICAGHVRQREGECPLPILTEEKGERNAKNMNKCQELLARDLPYLSFYTLKQVLAVRNVKGVETLQTEMALVNEAYFRD
jgi:hypothetical protein